MNDADNYSDGYNPDSSKDLFSHKLVLLGDMGVGKSSIATRYVYGKFSAFHETTIGACFHTRNVELNDYVVKFEIWDTAGQERYHALAQMYYKNAIAAIVVFDVTNANSFQRAKKWVDELQENASPDIVVALAGNKIDVGEYNVNKDEVKKYTSDQGLLYMEVSAKENLNIDALFFEIAKKLPKKDNKRTDQGMKLKDEKKESEGGMCPC